jgi:hypothetical protein
MAVLFPKVGVERITEKIVRGITFIEGSMLIEPSHKIDVFVLNDEGAAPIRESIERYGTEYARGPGIVVRRAAAHDDPRCAVFEIELFQQFRSYAGVLPISSDTKTERGLDVI